MKSPAEIAQNYIKIAQGKTAQKWYKLLILAVLAGAFIAFGAAVATAAGANAGSNAALIKGLVFPVGLILVVVCGAELFTGLSFDFASDRQGYQGGGLFQKFGDRVCGKFPRRTADCRSRRFQPCTWT